LHYPQIQCDHLVFLLLNPAFSQLCNFLGEILLRCFGKLNRIKCSAYLRFDRFLAHTGGRVVLSRTAVVGMPFLHFAAQRSAAEFAEKQSTQEKPVPPEYLSCLAMENGLHPVEGRFTDQRLMRSRK